MPANLNTKPANYCSLVRGSSVQACGTSSCWGKYHAFIASPFSFALCLRLSKSSSHLQPLSLFFHKAIGGHDLAP